MFDVVVADARSPRDGRFIEKLGTYNPNTVPATINLNDEGALKWLMNGAQPSDTVRAILSYRGVMFKKHLQVGVNKGAVTQEDADARFDEWKQTKDAKITGRVEGLEAKKNADKQARFDAETKKNNARAEAIAKKNAVPEPVAEAPAEAEVEATTDSAAPEATETQESAE